MTDTSVYLQRGRLILLLLAFLGGCHRTEPRLDAGAPDIASPSAVRDNATVPTIAKGCLPALVAARRGGADADRYVVPTAAEREAIAEVVRRLAGDGASARSEAAARAALAGYEIIDIPETPMTVLLREVEARRRGGGAYVLRLGAPSELVVEAPHTFFDEGTLPLACELFNRARASALFVDTAHRYKAAAADEHGDHPADVAHASDSLFQAATEGVLRAHPRATIVQLHGFAERESGASVVVSSGAAHPGNELVERAAKRLTAVLGEGVRRFPDDTKELGATKNVQGQLARQVGARFLHVEIEAGVRKALLNDATLRGRFFDALTSATDDR